MDTYTTLIDLKARVAALEGEEPEALPDPEAVEALKEHFEQQMMELNSRLDALDCALDSCETSLREVKGAGMVFVPQPDNT